MEVKDRMDAFYLGDALRALDFIPTLEMVRKLGGTETKGQKFYTIEEFLPIVHQVSQTKDMGNLEVFVECLRLYDRDENGLIMREDLNKVLTQFGEQMEQGEVDVVLQECCEPEDEDGCVPYEDFLARICQGPHVDFYASLA